MTTPRNSGYIKVSGLAGAIHRTVPDTELLELLTTLSMIHRRLDTTVKL
ncbi:MAG: hypothetical protein U5O16_37385 [Rhodococcus sp. (in: high G+C Gram-positive bacteria)]|nr:hypothetical protein [Rhodococcus sp. (in: high G+C Gram-positive bacteria)]